MRSSLRALRDFVWPNTCAGCARTPVPNALCASCAAAIVAGGPICGRCGRAMPPPARRCAVCRTHGPQPDSVIALGAYVRPSPLAAAVLQLKYAGQRQVARDLGALLATRCPFPPDAVVVPVPLHPARLRARGYNQAALLAAVVAREHRWPLRVRALRRLRATGVQAALASAAARRRNILAAFAVRQPRAIAGRTVVLIDDIVTTGATADACAAALRAAGAAEVLVYAIGRTP